MKKSKQCPKCDSLRIGFIAAQPDSSIAGKHRFLTSRVTTFRNQETRTRVGPLEAYVCTDCGFHETYVSTPTSIHFDDLEGFRWVNPVPPKKGPFR